MSNYSDRRRNVSIPAAILTHDVQAKHRALKFDPLRQTDAHVLTHINGNLSPARTRTLGALASKKTGRNQWVFPGKSAVEAPSDVKLRLSFTLPTVDRDHNILG